MKKAIILFEKWLVSAYGKDYKYVVRNNLPILREAFLAGYNHGKTTSDCSEKNQSSQ